MPHGIADEVAAFAGTRVAGVALRWGRDSDRRPGGGSHCAARQAAPLDDERGERRADGSQPGAVRVSIAASLYRGLGKRTAIVALILYALLPVLRNTVTGILSVDRGVRDSAVALGMTGRQIFWGVELPLAFPTILAGIRIATVTTIGTATIAAAIGGGGLGVFVFRGIAMADSTTILAGAVPAALMAIAADEVLGWIERRVSY